MGQSESSSANSCSSIAPKDEKQKAEPTFVEVMQKRAIDAQANHNAVIEAMLAEDLTETARIKDVLDCVEILLKLMVEKADKGQREFSCELKSPLFVAAWSRAHAAYVPGVYYETSFSSRLMQHAQLVAQEFSKRTAIPVLSSDDFDRSYRNKSGCQTYDKHLHDGYSRVGFRVRY